MAEPLSAADMVALTKKHTFFSWSAQGAVNPIPMVKAKGVYFWDADGKRYLDMNSQLMCVNIGHGDQRVIDAIKAQAEELAYAGPGMATRVRAEIGPLLASVTPGRPGQILLYPGRGRGQRECHQAGARLYRPAEDHHPLSLVSRRHGRRHQPHRRPAPLGQ